MPKQSNDRLLLLIKSLTKSEKRSFRLFINKRQTDSHSVNLFNHLDKVKQYDESQILTQIPQIKKSQLSNIKAHLFKQILSCLRQLERSRASEIEIREQIDFAKILYDKGMYKPCLEILDKAKKQAVDINYESLVLSILYFEKRIESQHVTGSMSNKADQLTWQSDETLSQIQVTNQLSNLSLLLYGRYLKNGYVKNEDDYMHLKYFFESNLPALDPMELKFYQKLYLFQSYVWYYNMAQDFPQYYRYAQKWVNLYENDTKLILNSTSNYLKGVHNMLNALFMAQHRDRFNEAFKDYANFNIDKQPAVTQNELSIYYLFYYIHFLNQIIINSAYGDNREKLSKLEILLTNDEFNWDINRKLIFRYKMACIYFGDNNLDDCISCLNEILNKSYPKLRVDLQCFARILNLIAHYELGNNELVTNQLKSLYRFLYKMKDLGKVQQAIILFLKRTPRMFESDMKTEFQNLKEKLLKIRNEKYEKRPFLYLEIIAWLDAKISDCTIADILKLKNNNNNAIA